MALTEASSEQEVSRWASSAAIDITPLERDALKATLMALSAHTTTHIVADTALTVADTQSILLDRVTTYLEDWLALAALSLRRQLPTDANWHATTTEDLPIGLRSASPQERIDLPVIGAQLEKKLAQYLAQQPGAAFDDLTQINGIGAAGLKKLREVSYLDRPALSLLSPSLLRFLKSPDIVSAIALLDASDLHLVYGDWLIHLRRGVPNDGVSWAARWQAFLEFVTVQAKAEPHVARGVLASEALARVQRGELLAQTLANAAMGEADLVVNDVYVEAALSLIAGATSSLSLMVFLGTDSEPIAGGAAPEVLIEALEAASANVQVRVILDQDDLDDPYLSKVINQPLLNRLQAAGIPVKFDEKNVLLHSKVLIADSERVLVGSHNWTRSGFNATHEVSVRATQTELAQSYQARFDTLWAAL